MNSRGLALAAKVLTGISIGDAFGESFFGEEHKMRDAVLNRVIPPTSWAFSDDTVMAIALYKSLETFGTIDQHFVARAFLENYQKDSCRGYGPSMHSFFREMDQGEKKWEDITGKKFEGMGSMGNGGAMRAGVVGAYFFEDMNRVVEQAELSCTITHTNIEAICGAIAIAKACALTAREYSGLERYTRDSFLEAVIKDLPDCDTSWKIRKAFAMKGNYSMQTMISALGNGIRMLAQDTVPLALWCVARHLKDFESCLWEMVSAFGDRDTLCAIAGGIGILSASPESIPNAWPEHVECWRGSIFYL